MGCSFIHKLLIMKRIVAIAVVLMVISGAVQAQEKSLKKFENIFQIGAGWFLEHGYDALWNNPGLALRLSYGLDIRLNDSWSVMPGIGTTGMIGEIRNFKWEKGALYAAPGADPDLYRSVDLFCDARYHIFENNFRVVVGLGPGISYSWDKDTYYIDADLSDPLNQYQKFKKWGIWLRPSVMFELGKHFKLGFEGNIGLNNMRILYSDYPSINQTHFNNLMIVAGIGF